MAGRRTATPAAAHPRPQRELHAGDVVGRYQARPAAGDTEAVVDTFAPDGYYREPTGPASTHRGTAELRAFFDAQFGAGGHRLADLRGDRRRRPLRGGVQLRPLGRPLAAAQAGLAVYERSRDGLLAAVRVYDDVEAPVVAVRAEAGSLAR